MLRKDETGFWFGLLHTLAVSRPCHFQHSAGKAASTRQSLRQLADSRGVSEVQQLMLHHRHCVQVWVMRMARRRQRAYFGDVDNKLDFDEACGGFGGVCGYDLGSAGGEFGADSWAWMERI